MLSAATLQGVAESKDPEDVSPAMQLQRVSTMTVSPVPPINEYRENAQGLHGGGNIPGILQLTLASLSAQLERRSG